jgi:hypothetical protein
MTDLVLLSALLGGPAYGYALKRTAGLIFGNGVLHNNVVYPLLKKFVASGWVEQTTVPGDRGQPMGSDPKDRLNGKITRQTNLLLVVPEEQIQMRRCPASRGLYGSEEPTGKTCGCPDST